MILRTLCPSYRFLTTANCFIVKFYFRPINSLYFVKPSFLMGAGEYADVNSLKQAASHCGSNQGGDVISWTYRVWQQQIREWYLHVQADQNSTSVFWDYVFICVGHDDMRTYLWFLDAARSSDCFWCCLPDFGKLQVELIWARDHSAVVYHLSCTNWCQMLACSPPPGPTTLRLHSDQPSPI